jgi:phosphoadenosine phosphosulfate reductase
MSDLHRRVAETSAILERIARDFTPAVFASSLC